MKTRNGITLIALIITIIVLLILAGVTISLVVGDNGIFSKSTQAKIDSIIAQEKEQVNLSYNAAFTNKLGDLVTSDDLQTELDLIVGSNLTVVTSSGNSNLDVWFKETNHNYSINQGKIIRLDDGENVSSFESEEVYVAFYSDGTLVFSNNEEAIDSSKVEENFGECSTYYYDDSMEGSPAKWWDYSDRITKIKILNKIKPNTMSEWFSGLGNLTEIENLGNINTSNVNDMTGLFWDCTSLTNLDLRNLDTSNVEIMEAMFRGCINLTSINLSNFNTSNVTEMTAMFDGCESLTSLNLSNFNTSNVTDMSWMFFGCTSLTSLDLSNFNTSKVEWMSDMFCNCSSLTSLDLSDFNVSNVSLMDYMFFNCTNLTNINLSNFNTSNVTDMTAMFGGCTSLTNLDLRDLNTSNVKKMEVMFEECSNLTSLDLSNFDTQNVTNMKGMFDSCESLVNLDLSSFNTLKVTSMRSMFARCPNLIDLDLSSFNTSNVTEMVEMFYNCTSLRTIYASDSFVTTSITASANHKYMFSNCTSLVGGNGTTYNSSYTNKTYAKIDGGTSSPGYFTLKSN